MMKSLIVTFYLGQNLKFAVRLPRAILKIETHHHYRLCLLNQISETFNLNLHHQQPICYDVMLLWCDVSDSRDGRVRWQVLFYIGLTQCRLVRRVFT